MPKSFEEKLDEFSKRLDHAADMHEERRQDDIQALREIIHTVMPKIPSGDFSSHLNRAAQRLDNRTAGNTAHYRVDLNALSELVEVDNQFLSHFQIQQYYQISPIQLPNNYCETLEEFFLPLIQKEDISPDAQSQQLAVLVQEARTLAEKSNGGGIQGYFLPGLGCYLNGWLLAYGDPEAPRQALMNNKVLHRTIATAVHEKLGHGFLSVFSELGRARVSLGLYQQDIARRFGMHRAEDPLAALRQKQYNILFQFSTLVEEGWATWLETYMMRQFYNYGQHPRYTLQEVIQAVSSLPADMPDSKEIQEAVLYALDLIFGEETQDAYKLLKAVYIIENIEPILDTYSSSPLRQPLRYVIGELIFAQVELNCGPLCAPYAALIASCISIQPDQISMTDLRELMQTDPRLNPDARLAMVSKLKLSQPNNVAELAQKARSIWSLHVPSEII